MWAFALPPGARGFAPPPRLLRISARPVPRLGRQRVRAAASGAPPAPDPNGDAPPPGLGGGGEWLAEVDALRAALRCTELEEYAEQRKAGLTAPAGVGVGADWEFSDVWALSVLARRAFELRNQYSRVGISLEKNFARFLPVNPEAGEAVAAASLEALSSAKARAVYFATGLPAIAETSEMMIDAPESGSRINKTLQQGYRTRDVLEEGDAMIERVRPISDENRRTSFLSAVAYFDGESEILTHGRADVAIVFANARRNSIAVSTALDNLYMQLTRRLGLKLVPPRGAGFDGNDGDGVDKGPKLVGATMLRERIMREGEMLDGGILKVSSFLNHMVDTELMEACGIELAQRMRKLAPTKVLTVESTGLIIGLPTARHLNVPLVFARKTRPIAISDSFQTTYRSATKGTSNDLIVSCDYLDAGDRVVIIDDFLAGGSTAEALFKLVNMANAKIVGVGVAIEKMSDGGRSFLSGYNVPVESLAKVLPGSDAGRIDVMEEEPWESPSAARDEQVEIASSRIRTARETAARRMKRQADQSLGRESEAEGVSVGEDDGEMMDDGDDDDDDDSDEGLIYDIEDEDDFDAIQDDMERDPR